MSSVGIVVNVWNVFFSLRTLSHREVVPAMQTILDDENITQDLRLVSTLILLHGRVRFGP